MFSQRHAIKQNDKAALAVVVDSIGRNLNRSVPKLVLRQPVEAVTLSLVPSPTAEAVALTDVPECENGVCNLSWKPQKPAA